MKHLFVAASAIVLAVGFAYQNVDAALTDHYEAMRKANTLKVEYTATKLSGGSEKGTLLFARKDKFRIDTPSSLIVSNGTTTTILDKAANTYTEQPTKTAQAKTGDAWAWQMFWSDATGHFDLVSMSSKGSRTLRGVQLNEYVLNLKDGKSVTLFVDSATKLARGFSNTEKLVMGTAVTNPTLPDDTKDFTFVAPEGAKLVVKPVEPELNWADVEPIFKANCSGCHGGGGFNATSYHDIMARVVAGDAAKSTIIQYIRGVKKPQMPKGKVMAQKDIETLESWVNQGAKK